MRIAATVASLLAIGSFAWFAWSRSRAAEPPGRAGAPARPPAAGVAIRAGDPPAIGDVVPRHAVTARVTRDGVPVGGARVWITDGSQPVVAEARTDREGRAAFDALPPGPYELWAAGDALASAPVRIDGGDAELALAPAANVRGTLAAEGAGSGAAVTLIPLDGDRAVRVATVDEAGGFAVDGVPFGRWRVEAAVPGHVAEDQLVRVAAPAVELAVRAVRAGSVRGVVVDAAGAPLANATIVLRDQAGVQRPLALAATGLRWVHPLAGTRQMPANASARFSAPRAGTRPSECGRGHCGIDIGSVRGTVVHAAADGEVAAIFAESRTEAGKLVAIHHGGGLETMYMHLDEIRPGLEVGQPIRAGEPLGLLGSTGFSRSIPHVHFAITYEAGRTWYLDPEPVLRHAVVLAAPRAYAPVVAGGEPAPPLAARPVVDRITTDARGEFRIAGVAPGSYVAGAFAGGHAPGASATFTVRGGEATADVAITLAAGVAVRGVVVGRDGPLAGAVVMAGAGFGETAHKIATTVTDAHGRFVLRALAGKVRLAVQAPRYGEAERVLVVDERTREQVFQLVIEDARLRGQVLAPDGGAAAGVVVRTVDGPTRRRTVTDVQGRFALDRVAAGSYVVELTSPDYPAKRVELASERWREIRLDPGGAARVVVRDAHAATPLARVRVELAGPGGRTASGTTDAAGALELRGLVPGAWRIAARTPGFAAAARTVEIRAERLPRDVALELARAASVAGTIRDRHGRRVAGARVWLGEASATSDADGDFRIADAPVGEGVLEAELDGARGALSIELRPGAERVALTIELQ